MAEISMPWNEAIIGDCGPYSDDQWTDMQRKIFQNDRSKDGVILAYLNSLLVTNPVGNTVRVASGGAMVDGKFYESDGNVDFAAVLNIGDYYRIVLRKSFAVQEVRLAILGPDPISTPALTQVDGVTWEIPLATILIIGGPAISITDEREYISMTSIVGFRQGGSATNFATVGTTNYPPALIRQQHGAVVVTFPGAPALISDEITITFPKAFSNIPVMFGSCYKKAAGELCFVCFTAITSTTFKIKCWCPTATAQSCSVYWKALGPF